MDNLPDQLLASQIHQLVTVGTREVITQPGHFLKVDIRGQGWTCTVLWGMVGKASQFNSPSVLDQIFMFILLVIC